MNLSALFIRRPVMTTLVMLSIIIFGLMGYRRLPVSDLPNVDFPTVMVSANLPAPALRTWLLPWPLPWSVSFPPSPA